MSKTALIVGSTGLIGQELLNLLLNSSSYEKVIAITRKPLELKNQKLDNRVIDFKNFSEELKTIHAQDVFCCLGTTMKKAGTKEKFRKIDYDYPLELAEVSKEQGAQAYFLISALGASTSSSVFYNQVKGEIEAAIDKVGFDRYHIFRPSLLLGDRNEDRVGEDAAKTIFKIFGFLFIGPLKKYKAIDHKKVARAMLYWAEKNEPGKQVHESLEMQKF